MSREVHVRFWESLRGKFLWATHLGGALSDGRPAMPFYLDNGNDTSILVTFLQPVHLKLNLYIL